MRSSSDANALPNQLRQTLRSLDPELAIDKVRFMNQIADASVATHRFALFLVGLFAELAVISSTIGMYGVISFSVNQRMSEFGLRLSLGAKSKDLLLLIAGQGLRLFVFGAAIGLVGATAMTKLLGNLLYEVSRTDAVTFVAVPVVGLTTTLLACYAPARRAMSADPMLSLRSE